MNYNFLETEFYYHNHFSSLGENSLDDSEDLLSWLVNLPSHSDEGPTEYAPGTATEHVSHTARPSPSSPSIDSPHPVSEVISKPRLRENTISTNPTGTKVIEGIFGDTGQYILPARSTRGVPPKRYSPERIGKKSRYVVANFVQENLIKMARAFEAALYEEEEEEEEIPQSAEKATRHKHRRDAMFTEMKTLLKNTWEVSKLPE